MTRFPGGNNWFFDSAAVLKALDAGERKALSKFGAFVRTRARSSIRTRKAVSRPGEPPTNRTGLLKRFLFFSYDPATRSVVVGPAAFKSRPTTPALLEFGGTRPADRRRRKAQNHRPRPFMAPALAAEMPKFAGLFAGMVKGG